MIFALFAEVFMLQSIRITKYLSFMFYIFRMVGFHTVFIKITRSYILYGKNVHIIHLRIRGVSLIKFILNVISFKYKITLRCQSYTLNVTFDPLSSIIILLPSINQNHTFLTFKLFSEIYQDITRRKSEILHKFFA